MNRRLLTVEAEASASRPDDGHLPAVTSNIGDRESFPLAGICSPALKSQILVLLVEDDKKLAAAVRLGMELEGCRVVCAATAEDALRSFRQGLFDIVLLDIVLPGKSGLQLLLEMRAVRICTPVLILSGRGTIGDRVLGLESGADDYMVKPVALPELLARIRALVRRGKPCPPEHLKCADLEIDLQTHTVKRAGTPLSLTYREFEILIFLCQNQGQVVSRETLARELWKEPNRYTPLDNVINVHLTRLRSKVDDNFECKLIHTVRRVGYLLGERAD